MVRYVLKWAFISGFRSHNRWVGLHPIASPWATGALSGRNVERAHAQEEVDPRVQDLLAKLPNRTGVEGISADSYERERNQAAIELEQEQHAVMGFMDELKAFFMWVETPEERMSKNRGLRVEEA